jgi:methionyl-tRNA formyltransferase
VQVELTDAGGKVRVVATVLKCRATGSEAMHSDVGVVLADRTVACGLGSLEITTVQPVGKKGMDLKAFANGYGFGEGARLQSVVPVPGGTT